MKLTELYSLRTDFTVIGLTGRTGSGCTRIAELLSGSFEDLEEKGVRDLKELNDPIFIRKFKICKDYFSYKDNWVPFQTIRYVDVLLFYILHKYGGDYAGIKKILLENFRERKDENNIVIVNKVLSEIKKIDSTYTNLITRIKDLPDFHSIKSDTELKNLNELFFGTEYSILKDALFKALEEQGYFRTRLLLHWVSCNIRSTGDPAGQSTKDIKHIYSLANLVNRLIKAKHVANSGKPTKIVIDSLRNSLEIMFFKERYSAFYMVAAKDVINNAKNRLEVRLESKITDKDERSKVIDQILELDAVEYRTKDFAKGHFSSPDVENCIQKSDYHIFNLKKAQLNEFAKGNPNSFYTREEQIMKLIALINQPGIITPSSAERAMQIAQTAKLNSGCISRKVGAVVTDTQYYVKAIGWNDVAKGHTPCNLRSVTDFFQEVESLDENQHYSVFEKGKASETSSFKYKGDNPGNFKEAIVDYFKEAYDKNSDDLRGKNCSFCFKTVHNHYEGEANQVHTRSLHAEENAMLQITKLGGMGANGGFLFTTASPCELCSKKAYQLGITKIFYIDPYPGIAIDQILKGGLLKNQPDLIPFYGAIGNAYHELYDSFMSYKDEVAMTLELQPKQKLAKELNNVLSKIKDSTIKEFIKREKLSDEKIVQMIHELINNHARKKQD